MDAPCPRYEEALEEVYQSDWVRKEEQHNQVHTHTHACTHACTHAHTHTHTSFCYICLCSEKL